MIDFRYIYLPVVLFFTALPAFSEDSTIQSLNKDLACNTAADCVMLPVGNIPCGGPASYLAASKKNKSLPALEKYLADQAKKQEEAQLKNQMKGTCIVTSKPNVACTRGKCSQAP